MLQAEIGAALSILIGRASAGWVHHLETGVHGALLLPHAFFSLNASFTCQQTVLGVPCRWAAQVQLGRVVGSAGSQQPLGCTGEHGGTEEDWGRSWVFFLLFSCFLSLKL